MMPKFTIWTGPTKSSERDSYFEEFRELVDNGKAKEIKDFGVVRVFEALDQRLIFAITASELIYFVRYSERTVHGKPYINQDEVWRATSISDEINSLRLPKWVFLNVLLQKRDCLVSDEEHTDSGKRFWEARVSDALADHRKVFYLDWKTGLRKRLLDKREIPDFLWGHTERHRDHRLVIEA